MKKLFSLLFSFLTILLLISCGDVGNPTITYIDEMGNEKSQMIHSSANSEYVEQVVSLINKIKPTKYSYFITTKGNANLNINNNEITYYFFSGDELIYDHNKNITYNKINVINNLSLNNNAETSSSNNKKIEEYCYSNLTYVYEDDNLYTKDSNMINSNIFNLLEFNKIFNNLDKKYIEEYNLFIYDVSKTSIIFSIDYAKLVGKSEIYNYDTTLHFTIDASNGLLKSIELINYNIALDNYKSLTNNEVSLEEITYINCVIIVNVEYDNIPNIALSKEELAKFN